MQTCSVPTQWCGPHHLPATFDFGRSVVRRCVNHTNIVRNIPLRFFSQVFFSLPLAINCNIRKHKEQLFFCWIEWLATRALSAFAAAVDLYFCHYFFLYFFFSFHYIYSSFGSYRAHENENDCQKCAAAFAVSGSSFNNNKNRELILGLVTCGQVLMNEWHGPLPSRIYFRIENRFDIKWCKWERIWISRFDLLVSNDRWRRHNGINLMCIVHSSSSRFGVLATPTWPTHIISDKWRWLLDSWFTQMGHLSGQNMYLGIGWRGSYELDVNCFLNKSDHFHCVTIASRVLELATTRCRARGIGSVLDNSLVSASYQRKSHVNWEIVHRHRSTEYINKWISFSDSELWSVYGNRMYFIHIVTLSIPTYDRPQDSECRSMQTCSSAFFSFSSSIDWEPSWYCIGAEATVYELLMRHFSTRRIHGNKLCKFGKNHQKHCVRLQSAADREICAWNGTPIVCHSFFSVCSAKNSMRLMNCTIPFTRNDRETVARHPENRIAKNVIYTNCSIWCCAAAAAANSFKIFHNFFFVEISRVNRQIKCALRDSKRAIINVVVVVVYKRNERNANHYIVDLSWQCSARIALHSISLCWLVLHQFVCFARVCAICQLGNRQLNLNLLWN